MHTVCSMLVFDLKYMPYNIILTEIHVAFSATCYVLDTATGTDTCCRDYATRPSLGLDMLSSQTSRL